VFIFAFFVLHFNPLSIMKKSLLLFAVLFSAAFSVYAQDYEPTPAISAGFSAGATVGAHSGEFPVAGGVHISFEYPFANQLSLMVTTGYTFYVSGNGYTVNYDEYGSQTTGELVSFIPVTAGLRYYVANKLFIQGDAGASFNLNSANYYTNKKKVALLVSPGIGYAVGFGSTRYGLDLSLAYDARIESAGDVNSSGYNTGSYNSVVFRLAFRFGL